MDAWENSWKMYREKCVNSDGTVYYHTKMILNARDLSIIDVPFRRTDRMDKVLDNFSTRIKNEKETPMKQQSKKSPVKSVLSSPIVVRKE